MWTAALYRNGATRVCAFLLVLSRRQIPLSAFLIRNSLSLLVHFPTRKLGFHSRLSKVECVLASHLELPCGNRVSPVKEPTQGCWMQCVQVAFSPSPQRCPGALAEQSERQRRRGHPGGSGGERLGPERRGPEPLPAQGAAPQILAL